MKLLREIKDSFLHLLFPHICNGCGNDIIEDGSSLCLRCLESLPATQFEKFPENPVEKIFWGRLPLVAASAHLYFTKESLVQGLMHTLKYKGNKDLGIQLGILMGEGLLNSGRFVADALVPLPLFASRERKRGYNQASLLCEGIASMTRIPILKDIIIRPEATETQTHKNRIERWSNMEGKFELVKPERIRNRHLLLVDDVITTGATLESCGLELLKAEGTTLSIATLCYASK